TALVWAVPDRPKLAAEPLTPAQVQSAWATLADADAARAYAALWKLAAAPGQAVRVLRERLPPVPPVQAEVVARYRQALESGKFQERQKAVDGLRNLGPAGEPLLRALLAGKPPLEVQRRVEPLLALLESAELSPERLRIIRALEVLEQVNTAEARQVL